MILPPYIFVGFNQSLVYFYHRVEIFEESLCFVKNKNNRNNQKQKINFAIVICSDSVEIANKNVKESNESVEKKMG
jgi:hypothetical protein